MFYYYDFLLKSSAFTKRAYHGGEGLAELGFSFCLNRDFQDFRIGEEVFGEGIRVWMYTCVRVDTFRTSGALDFVVLGATHLPHRWC